MNQTKAKRITVTRRSSYNSYIEFSIEVEVNSELTSVTEAINSVKESIDVAIGSDLEEIKDKRRELTSKIDDLKIEKNRIERELAEVKDWHTRAATFLEQLGFDSNKIFSGLDFLSKEADDDDDDVDDYYE